MRRTACSLQFHKQRILNTNGKNVWIGCGMLRTYLDPSMAAQEEIKFCWVAYILINYSSCKFEKHLSKIIVKKNGTNQQWQVGLRVSNQLGYFHSCLSTGDHFGCWGIALCGASSAPLWRWSVAFHCKELSMPEEEMKSINNWANIWCATLKLFLPSLSQGFLVPALV